MFAKTKPSPQVIIATIATLLIVGFTTYDMVRLKNNLAVDSRLNNGTSQKQADFYWKSQIRMEQWTLAEIFIFNSSVFFIAYFWLRACKK